ncbi:MAG: EpsG family protein [Lachnospiraceae bacterium]|nr:EpsG family protein [Lachnospiraceae bacterium]
MVYYIFLTAVCVFMAFFVNGSYRRQANLINGKEIKTALPTRQETINRCILVGIFLVLFLLSALRYGIGNDYWTYRYEFLDIHRADTKISYEIGFQTFVRVMQFIVGVDNYIPIFAVMAFFTCLFFLKGLYDTSDWFFLSFFIYMANGFYFMSFSNIRYYFVLALVMYSMKYLFKREFVKFCLIICFAAFFHMTALLVIPAYFVAYCLKWSKKTIWLIPAVSLILIFGRIPIRRLLFVFYPYYEGDKILDVTNISWVNIAKCAAILIFCLIFYKKAIKGNEKAEMYFNLNLFALILYSFATYVPELSRVCYYLIISQVYLIPIVIKGIESKKLRRICLVAVCAAYFGYFMIFLKQGYDPVVQILPYFSWAFI